VLFLRTQASLCGKTSPLWHCSQQKSISKRHDFEKTMYSPPRFPKQSSTLEGEWRVFFNWRGWGVFNLWYTLYTLKYFFQFEKNVKKNLKYMKTEFAKTWHVIKNFEKEKKRIQHHTVPGTKRAHWGLAAQFGTGCGALPKVWSNTIIKVSQFCFDTSSALLVCQSAIIVFLLLFGLHLWIQFGGIFLLSSTPRKCIEKHSMCTENIWKSTPWCTHRAVHFHYFFFTPKCAFHILQKQKKSTFKSIDFLYIFFKKKHTADSEKLKSKWQKVHREKKYFFAK